MIDESRRRRAAQVRAGLTDAVERAAIPRDEIDKLDDTGLRGIIRLQRGQISRLIFWAGQAVSLADSVIDETSTTLPHPPRPPIWNAHDSLDAGKRPRRDGSSPYVDDDDAGKRPRREANGQPLPPARPPETR